MELLSVIERRIKNFYPNAFNFSLSVSNNNNSVYLHFQCFKFIRLQFVNPIQDGAFWGCSRIARVDEGPKRPPP